ncbi:MAG TPA: ferredoxin [Mycobacteriales bacterium]|nr:ferredoxin [Mycobacteriales bacterium]
MTEESPSRRFRIDMAACDGYGMCAELVPELIRLDDWGYPLLSDAGVPPELVGYARRAVHYCPRLALSLVPE